MGNCHKCKFEITAECVPRSQKMGFPNCYQSTITNADRIRSMTDEELAHFLEMKAGRFVSFYPTQAKSWLDWLRQEALP